MAEDEKARKAMQWHYIAIAIVLAIVVIAILLFPSSLLKSIF